MKSFHFYEEATGVFCDGSIVLNQHDGHAATAQRNAPPGHKAIEGRFDRLSQRVDIAKVATEQRAQLDSHAATVEAMHEAYVPVHMGGSVSEFRVPAPPVFMANAAHVIDYQPPQPSPEHEWNHDTRRWRLSESAQAKVEASVIARARIAALEASQHSEVRKALLGDRTAMGALQAIEDEIVGLRHIAVPGTS